MALFNDDYSINSILGNGSTIKGNLRINGCIHIDGDFHAIDIGRYAVRVRFDGNVAADETRRQHDKQKIEVPFHLVMSFDDYPECDYFSKCIRILEARISTTTGLEPRGRMMSAVRLVGSMNCWCIGFTKVW